MRWDEKDEEEFFSDEWEMWIERDYLIDRVVSMSPSSALSDLLPHLPSLGPRPYDTSSFHGSALDAPSAYLDMLQSFV